MTTELEVELTENFGFRLSRIVQLTLPFEDDELPQTVSKLIAWDNVHKRFAFADKQKLIINNTEELNQFLLDFSKDDLSELDTNLIIELSGITHIEFTSDYTRLVVITGSIIYELDSFENGNLQKIIELSDNVKILKNCPSHSNVLFVLDVSNNLYLINIKDKSSTHIKSEITSFDTITGKEELLIADALNTISRINLNGDLVLNITVPSEDGFTISDTTSVSDTQYLIISNNEENESVFYLLDTETNQIGETNNILTAVTDIPRNLFFYQTVLANWSSSFPKLIFLASSLSSDIEVLTPSKLIEELNDTDRAQLPLDEDTFIDAIPTGIVLDITNSHKIETDISPRIEENSIDPLPRLVVLTHDGKLCVWNIYDIEGVLKNTLKSVADLQETNTKLAQALQTNPDLSLLSTQQPKATGDIFSKPNPFSSNKPFPSLENAPNAFGNTNFGLSTSSTAPPAFGTFGSSTSSTQESSFGKSPFASLGANTTLGNKPVFGSEARSDSPFSNFSGFGKTLQEQSSASPFASLQSKEPTLSDDDDIEEDEVEHSESDSDIDESDSGLREPIKENKNASNAGPTSFGSGPTSFGSGPTSFGSGPTSFGSGPTSFGSGPTSFGSGPTSFGSTGFGNAGPTSFGSTSFGGAGPTSFGSGATNFGSTSFGSTSFGGASFGTFGSKKEESKDKDVNTTKSAFGSAFGAFKGTDSPFGAFKGDGASPFSSLKTQNATSFGGETSALDEIKQETPSLIETVEQKQPQTTETIPSDVDQEDLKSEIEIQKDEDGESSESFTIVDKPQETTDEKLEVLEPTSDEYKIEPTSSPNSDENDTLSNADEEGEREISEEKQQVHETEKESESGSYELAESIQEEDNEQEDNKEEDSEKDIHPTEVITDQTQEEISEDKSTEPHDDDDFDEAGESEIYDAKTGSSTTTEDVKEDVQGGKDDESPTPEKESLTNLVSLFETVKKLKDEDIENLDESEKNLTLAALIKAINLNGNVIASLLKGNGSPQSVDAHTATEMVSQEMETEPEKFENIQTEEKKTVDYGLQTFEDDELYISKVNKPLNLGPYLKLGNIEQPDHSSAGVLERKMQDLYYYVQANFTILLKNLATIQDFILDHDIDEDGEELWHTEVSLAYPSYWRLSECETIQEFIDDKRNEYAVNFDDLEDIKLDLKERFEVFEKLNEKVLKVSEFLNGFENFKSNLKLLKSRQISFANREIRAAIIEKTSKYEAYVKEFEIKIILFKLIFKITTSGDDNLTDMVWDRLSLQLNELTKSHYSDLKDLKAEIEVLSHREVKQNSELLTSSTASLGNELIPLKINELQNSNEAKLQIGELLRSRTLNIDSSSAIF